ncbi:MAG TPA: hypothetical protein VMU16_07095 [Candidatus Binataceae bacterium]|nr:hypothetical protein [Candidatus Binataceae bacterium]
MALASKVRDFIRHEGLFNLPQAAFNALKPLDFRIFVIDRSHPVPEVPISEGVTMYENALDRLRSQREGRTDLPNEFWRDQINGAAQCATLEFNGELGGIVWAYEYPAQRPVVILAPGEAELTASRTLERFQGRGLYRSLLRFATVWQLRERPRLFTVVASDNPTPYKAVLELGFREIAAIRRRPVRGPKFSVSGMCVTNGIESGNSGD